MGRELKRVPLDFDCPIDTTWPGYVNPHYTAKDCPTCGGSGYSRRAKELHDQWYGNAPFSPRETGSTPWSPGDLEVLRFAQRNVAGSHLRHGLGIIQEAHRLACLFNRAWSHHLAQEDVDALVQAGRLMDFTHTWTSGDGWRPKDPPYRPTAQEVNRWSLVGMGHDSINCWICVEDRCKREGVEPTCPSCNGHGAIWPSAEAEQKYEAWEPTEPPTGDGYQIWQTVGDGGPVSPVFGTPEQLASWMVTNDDSVTSDTTYEQWIAFIRGPGWAPSMVGLGADLMSGVKAISS